jgi:hypothetical protein
MTLLFIFLISRLPMTQAVMPSPMPRAVKMMPRKEQQKPSDGETILPMPMARIRPPR